MTSAIHRPPTTPAPALTTATTATNNTTATVSQDLQTPNFGTIDLRLTIQHDMYPRETSWDLRHLDSFVQLYWQPFDSITEPLTIVSQRFSDLPAGTYQLRMIDSNGDGISKVHTRKEPKEEKDTSSSGIVAVTVNEHVVWQHAGNFSKILEVTLELSQDGRVVFMDEQQDDFVSQSQVITNRNSAVIENDPSRHDRYWPGECVYICLFEITVNVWL